ncbi:MAG TPA: T9SS type A sorting domain-containing protein [Ignavibacteriaceae bacterium]|nr:T9SS type A sorting domain-containing protein [Ignavibacteriaceae bacterium]
MKKIIIISFLIQVVFSGYIYSQFTGYYGTINKKPAYWPKESVISLGDQNNDGYDDFMIYENREYVDQTAFHYIYNGGLIIDTIPKLCFSLPFTRLTISAKLIPFDINKDGYKDIILSALTSIFGGDPRDNNVLIYYGGPQLDSIPDQIMEKPNGASRGYGINMEVLNDFNGDGVEELAIFDYGTRYSPNKQFGTIYFYKIENGRIDTIPITLMEGDSVTLRRINSISSIDLNNDGLSDLIIKGYKSTYGGVPGYDFMEIYLGNPDWDISLPAQEFRAYTQSEIGILTRYFFIKDINRDGKVDLISDYKGDPYYHKGAILKGGYPVDTTIWKTLNTSNRYISNEIAGEIDANGDGINDLLIKMFGLGTHDTYLWLGTRNFAEYPTKKWLAQDYWEGAVSGNLGDVNGDGADDIFIGQTDDNISFYRPGKVEIFLGDTSVHVDTTTDIEDDEIKKTESYQLLAAYPNPFNPETVIIYELPVNSKVILGIYDILGREVAKLVDKEQEAGKYEIRFNGSGLASGVYIVSYSYRQSDGIELINSLKIELIK